MEGVGGEDVEGGTGVGWGWGRGGSGGGEEVVGDEADEVRVAGLRVSLRSASLMCIIVYRVACMRDDMVSR